MNQVEPLNGDLHTGHVTSSCMTSSQVTKTLTSITLHRIEIEPWALCLSRQDALNDVQYDLRGSFIRSGFLPDLRLNFQINLWGSKFIFLGASWREEYDSVSCFALSLLVQKLFAKNVIFPERSIFCLTCPGKVKMWTKEVKSYMVRFKTSRSFRLSLLRSSISIRGQSSRGSPPPGAV